MTLLSIPGRYKTVLSLHPAGGARRAQGLDVDGTIDATCRNAGELDLSGSAK